MKLLKTKDSFYKEISRLAKSKPLFFYIATYNLRVDDNIKNMLSSLPKKCDTRVLIGINEDASAKQIAFFKSYFSEVKLKLFKECHLKLVISDKGVIVGGRNITDSGWTDLSVLLIDKKTITQIKNEYIKHFNKKGI